MDIGAVYKDIFETELLHEMSAIGKYLIFNEGDIVMSSGHRVRFMPILLLGSLKIIRLDDDGNELLLYYVDSREGCAMTFTCCMQYQPSEIKAIAEEYTELIGIPVDVMDSWIVKYPSWKGYVMKTIHDRFNELLKTIDQLAFQKLDERLVHYLKEKARVTKSSLLNLSHGQIAVELATSRVVISRLLKKLEDDQKLLLYRNQIKLLRDM
jgi:CRP/FNR family transcriptional regulator